MEKTPVVSVIMSVYNGESYLEEAIESVKKQTYPNWELIVINDCSKDRTEEILRRFEEEDTRICVHTNEVNLRLPASLNKALSFARGKYIARMDADDICMPERLEKQVQFMETHPEVSLSSSRFMTLKNGVIASGGCGGKCDHDSIKARLLITNPILHPGVIAKSEVLKELRYDETLTCTEDLELWTRMVRKGYRVEIQPEYLMIYRLHDKQITSTTKIKQLSEVAAVQKAYFEALLKRMTPEQEAFYMEGIYFTDKTDIRAFCQFYRWMKQMNRKKNMLDTEALHYAAFEVLAEYKRKGISKSALIAGMANFPLPFLCRELRQRKMRAQKDGVVCIKAAKSLGLVPTGGTTECPIFSKIQGNRSE